MKLLQLAPNSSVFAKKNRKNAKIFQRTKNTSTLRSEGSKRSSKCSRMRPQLELKMQDELEGQTEENN